MKILLMLDILKKLRSNYLIRFTKCLEGWYD